MITPRLLRRALRRALQPRLLLLWWASLLLPGALAALPVFSFLRGQLDHSPRARDVVAWLDGSTSIELVRQVSESGTAFSLVQGAASAVLALLLVSPFVAGAMVTAARSDEALSLRRLLAGAGELYGRMLRTLLVSLVPLVLGAALSAGAMKLATQAVERAVTESAAVARLRGAALISALVLFVCHLLADAARAQFAAGPDRRSAAGALLHGARLLLRRPLRGFGVGALSLAGALAIAAAAMVLRLRIEQATPLRIGFAWALAQLAHLGLGWGRAARIFGLAELARADAADRARPFQLDPPASSPGAGAQPTMLSALPGAPLSPTGASGT